MGKHRIAISAVAVLALVGASCSSSSTASDTAGTPTTGPDRTTVDVATDPCIDTPTNPFDAAGNSDRSTPGPGPVREASTTDEDVSYRFMGPAHFTMNPSPVYPDGRRVYWSQGGDRLLKVDYDTYDITASLPMEGRQWTEPEAQATVESLLDAPPEAQPQEAVGLLTELFVKTNILASSYSVLDTDNRLYLGNPRGFTVYTDADPDDADSAIVDVGSFTLPDEATGTLVGMVITYDGDLVLATDEGYLVAIDRSTLEPLSVVALDHQSEGGPRWVRNSMVVDDDGGIYLVSNGYLHKVVWTGAELTTDPAQGAWSEPYEDDGSGSGSTPQLMGWGPDCDRVVLIQDGRTKMNLAAYWRDTPPDGWTPDPSYPSARMAGRIPVTAGDVGDGSTQSENSPTVYGYDVLLINNQPLNVPADIPPNIAVPAIGGFLGGLPRYTPHGAQLVRWDPDAHAFAPVWENTELASPSAVPAISGEERLVYTVGPSGDRVHGRPVRRPVAAPGDGPGRRHPGLLDRRGRADAEPRPLGDPARRRGPGDDRDDLRIAASATRRLLVRWSGAAGATPPGSRVDGTGSRR